MRSVITFFLVVIGLAIVAALGTRRLTDRPDETSDLLLHRWLHEELKLTPEQRAAIERTEAAFASEEKRLRTHLNDANRELARVIREDEAYTPRVVEAVEKVHHCMGEMQKFSIAHLLEMRSLVDERQGETLMHYAEIALTDTR